MRPAALDKPANRSDYSMMFWIALAAQLSTTVPTNFNRWFSSDDMPSHVIDEGTDRQVLTRTVVAPDGTAQKCDVEGTSGDQKLDLYTCALILKRGKFEPARWIDGKAAYGVHRLAVAWSIGSPSSRPDPADIDLTVTHLPKGERSPLAVRVMFTANESGRPQFCTEEPPGLRFGVRNKAKTEPRLVQLACNELIKGYTAPVVKDSAGTPMPSVQDAVVHFRTN